MWRGWLLRAFASRTASTPSSRLAVTDSGSTSPGSVIWCSKWRSRLMLYPTPVAQGFWRALQSSSAPASPANADTVDVRTGCRGRQHESVLAAPRNLGRTRLGSRHAGNLQERPRCSGRYLGCPARWRNHDPHRVGAIDMSHGNNDFGTDEGGARGSRSHDLGTGAPRAGVLHRGDPRLDDARSERGTDRADGTGRTVGSQKVVATFSTYADAERAVDRLADLHFPVEKTAIVGRDLHTIEKVTGRLTWASAAGRSALAGALPGALIGWIFGLFNWINPVQTAVLLALYGAVFGAVLGALTGLLIYAFSRGRRDFVSVSALSADRYDLLVDADVADEAARFLAETEFGRLSSAGSGRS